MAALGQYMEFHLRLGHKTFLPPLGQSVGQLSQLRVASRRGGGRLNQLKLGAKKNKIRFVNGKWREETKREREEEGDAV